MLNKDILENFPELDIEDLSWEKDYKDGLVEFKATKEFQLNIKGEYWIDFDIEVTETSNPIECAFENPCAKEDKRTNIDVNNIILWNDGDEVKKGSDFYKLVERKIVQEVEGGL